MYLNRLIYSLRSPTSCVNTVKSSVRYKHFSNSSLNSFFDRMKRMSRIPPGLVSFRIIGSGAPGTPKSLFMFTDQTRYLFNCGEGTQRLAHEYKLKIACLEHLFITSATWENMGGLPGLSLTLQDVGIKQLQLHGPPGLSELFTATQKFVVLNKISVKAVSESKIDYEDSVMNVKYVLLESKNCEKKVYDDLVDNIKDTMIEDDTDYYAHEILDKGYIKNEEMNKLLQGPRKEKFSSMCYICKLKRRPGMLDLQKCVDKGIKPGPMLGLLKDGVDVTLPDGTIVLSADVKHPDDLGTVFMVIDVPDMSYLDSLLESECFRVHQEETATDPESLPTIIFHFTPDKIIQTEKYQSFIKSFPSTTDHMILNESNSCNGSLSVHRMQYQLNMINNDIFPIIKDRNNTNDLSNGNIHYCKTLTSYNVRPMTKLDRTLEIALNVDQWLTEPYAYENFQSSLQKYHLTAEILKESLSEKEYPKIVFLGTGSCIPNKTRNTSGILIHINENTSIIVDCGEGTYGQLVRFYGPENIDQVMKKVKAIYVSHLHADHHLGLINLLQNRRKALNRIYGEESYKDNELFLMAPKQISSYLCIYDKRFERIFPEFKLIPNSELEISDATLLESIMNHLNLANIETCRVKHCPNAYGVSFTTDNMVKITYSGDTMPCTNLVSIGKDSDILIHEATMEDDLASEARRKFHSTMQQAVDVGKNMNAKFTFLTHFSQRYARVPILSQECEENMLSKNVCIAFDNMEVAYKNLELLPHFYPVLKNLFAEHYEGLETKAAKRAAKRIRESTTNAKKLNTQLGLKL